MNKEAQQSSWKNNANYIFGTPLWHIRGKLPDPITPAKWAYQVEKEIKGVEKSNKGGYQSDALDLKTCPFNKHFNSMMENLPKVYVTDLWININRKGDYNVTHTHPNADLSFVWYITDDNRKLCIEDPLNFVRFSLNRTIDQRPICQPNCKAGDLIAFPADVVHWVEENDSDEPRITVSWNAILAE